MDNNCTTLSTEGTPLHLFLKQRRRELKLTQAQVAGALHVSPECVTLWESGRRRMELSRLPQIASVLQLDRKDLCAKALTEFYPSVFASLLDPEAEDAAPPEAA